MKNTTMLKKGTCNLVNIHSPPAFSSNPVLTGSHSPTTEVMPMPKTAAAASAFLSCIFSYFILYARVGI